MTIKTIYICRHGYRANWLPPPHPVNPTGIDSDPPLAPHGVEQAKQLAAHIFSMPDNQKPQIILSSPFYRCVETGQPIAELLLLQILLERGVGEWYKKNRGIVPEPADYDLLKKFFPTLADASVWGRDNLGVIPDLTGETEEDIFRRVTKFWSEFFRVFEAKFPHIERILIVTHAATKIALGMSLIGKSNVFEYATDDGEILMAGACSLDKYIKNGNSWELKINGDCSFLTKGEEMNWNFHSGFEAGSDEDIKARQKEAQEKALKEQQLNEKLENESIREKTPVTELAAGAEGSDEQYEDFYVTVEIPIIGTANNFDESDTPRSKPNMIKPSSNFQITNINDDHPFIKISNNNSNIGPEVSNNEGINNLSVIDGKIYQSNWNQLVGTELLFDDYGELIEKVTEHLTCNESVKVTPKDSQENNEDDEDEDMEGKESKQENTNFLKKAIKYAQKKKLESAS